MGSGIVGLASAYVLREAGHEVTVIDQARPGSGASGGNGAQLSYSYVQPLADPGLWRQLPKLLLSASSPLKLQPQWDIHQWRWGLKFLAACNASASRSTTASLLQLAAESRQSFDAMLKMEQLDCDFSATGKLVLYADQASFASASRQMLIQRDMGSMQEAVDADRCVQIEPALAHHHRNIAGAIYTPTDCAADCQKVCDGLANVLRARGVVFHLDTRITNLIIQNKRTVAVGTGKGHLEADAFVLALGATSAPMARKFGVDLAVYPLKGYSITVETGEAPHTAPRVSVTDSARKVVFARIGSRLRIAGMAELSGYGTSLSESQIASLKATAADIFPQCSDFKSISPWAGLRPASPSGMPLIGRHPRGPQNLMFNVGHGALGFTLAFGSAQRLKLFLDVHA